MSIVMPAIIVLETAVVLWLLIVFARQRRTAVSISSLKPPYVGMHHVEHAKAHVDAMKSRIFSHSSRSSSFARATRAFSSGEPDENAYVAREPLSRQPGQRASRAERPFSDKVHAIAFVRCHAHDSKVRPTELNDSPAQDAERGRGEAYFREALALLPISILMLGKRGLILMVNPQTAKMFGYECDALIGKPFELLAPGFRFDTTGPHWADQFALHESRNGPPSHELSARHSDGTQFRVEIDLKAFHFGDDCVTLASIIDRTERNELERNHRDLAHLARVCTVGQLASSLAHELNQPLTAILSNVQAAQRFLAADTIDLAEVGEILKDVVKDDYRASEVIRRIRAVVKKGDLEVASLDLAGIVRDVVFLVRSDAIVRGTKVTLEIDDDLPPVHGDKVQLQQVMLNLLLNAFDAMNNVPPIDRVVSVTLTREGKDRVGIAISDRGHGLTADKLDKIFKPFFTSKPQGLGLGLSISRSIIDMHHGRLWAENNIDRGATFFVTLPVGDATERDESR
ncbi:MAG: two-component system, LuxR family, sensor kinase FixL [Paraburkholderia sp.]|jgi:two-component system sensor kinase FixL|uniref:sensor histidine kinase n=1 Tax=Paraburkholderia sp. TaxID=1926495 RepID=UPI002AFF234E|nr:ATP-binding protein [Paraburkholderia sp.]MEA3083017.1 two-component system, LuxR family, sensor kinase FixL [Paraburkholderia sp.]